MAEETVILHFEVDQSKAERQLEKIEGILLDNKKAQQELTKAYKEGNITQEEYVKENIRLQQNIRKEQEQKKALIRTLDTESNSRNAIKQRVSQLAKEYDNLNLKTAQGAKRADELEKELAQLNAQLTKGDKAAGLFKNQIGNYPAQFADAAKNINVAGVSVGGLTSQFAAFANPAGIALGIVSGLTTAYASSTRGAKDLEFAQNQLAAAFSLANNELAKFISSSDEDGEGFFSSLANSFIESTVGSPAAAISKLAAKNIELLEDLERKELEVRANISDRIEDNQEQLEFIADEQKKINDRLVATDKIEQNLVKNKQEILAVLNEQLSALEFQLGLTDQDEAIQTLIAQKKREIAKESANTEKQLTRNNKLQDDLNAKLAKEVELRRQAAKAEQELFEFDVREANAPGISLENDPSAAAQQETAGIVAESKKRQEQYVSELQTVGFTEQQKADHYRETARIRAELDQQQIEREQVIADGTLAISSSLANGLSRLAKEGSDEQKALALTGIAVDTAAAIAGATANAQTVGYPGNLAAMASSIAAILAAIAEATAIMNGGFAEGGWTGPGSKYDVAGVVHADEYVVPKHVNNSPQAQPHLAALERMRGGYADGGFVVNQSTASSQQALIMANAMKNLPIPEVSVKEITQKQNRVRVRENVSTLNR